jgi:hypothetical protein
MIARVIIFGVAVSLTSGAAWLSWRGVWGESSTVVSTRVGTAGGYGLTGRVK